MRYTELSVNNAAPTAPTGIWYQGEAGRALAGVVPAAVLDITFVQQGNYVGRVDRVADQHEVDSWTLSGTSALNQSWYNGHVQAGSNWTHVYTATDPVDDGVQLGVITITTNSQIPPEMLPFPPKRGNSQDTGSFQAWIKLPNGCLTEKPLPYGATPTAPLAITQEDITVEQGDREVFRLDAATGGTMPYVYTLTPVPAWLTDVNPAGRVATVSATAPVGVHAFMWTVTDARGETATADFTITITSTGFSLPDCDDLNWQTESAVSVTLPVAEGGTAPITYVLEPATLPPGISLSNGVISGTTGTAPFRMRYTWTATDGIALNASCTFWITVTPTPGEPVPGPGGTESGGFIVLDYGDSLSNPPIEVGGVDRNVPAVITRGRDSILPGSRYETPSCTFTLYDPEFFTNPKLELGDYIRVLRRTPGEDDIIAFTGRVTDLGNEGEVINVDSVPVKAFGLSYDHRQNFPIVEPLYDASIMDCIGAVVNAAFIIDWRIDGTAWRRLPLFELTGDTHVISALDTLTSRTNGLPSFVREDRSGRLIMRDNSAYADETPWELNLGRRFRISKRRPSAVRQVRADVAYTQELAPGSILYSQSNDGIVVPLGPEGSAQIEISVGQNVWIEDLGLVSFDTHSGVTAISVSKIDAHTIQVFAIGRSDSTGFLNDLVVRGSGRRLVTEQTVFIPPTGGVTGVTERLGQYRYADLRTVIHAAQAWLRGHLPEGRRFFPRLANMTHAEVQALDENALVSANYAGTVLTGRILNYQLRWHRGIWSAVLAVETTD